MINELFLIKKSAFKLLLTNLFTIGLFSSSITFADDYLGRPNEMWAVVKKLSSLEREKGILNRNEYYYLTPGSGPLENAALFGYASVVKILSEDNCLLSKEGGKALYTATSMGRIEIMQILLKKGVDSNFKIEHDITPIYTAAEYGEIEAIKLLLREGADVNHKAATPYTLMQLVLTEKRCNVADLLLNSNYQASNNEISYMETVCVN